MAIHSRWTAESGYEWDHYPVGSPEYFDYLAENRSMTAVGAVSTERVAFRPRGGEPRMVTAGVVSPSAFRTLQVPPLLGRTLLDPDGGPDPAPVVVLAHDFWLREFGGDTAMTKSLSGPFRCCRPFRNTFSVTNCWLVVSPVYTANPRNRCLYYDHHQNKASPRNCPPVRWR